MIEFCQENLEELVAEQERIEAETGVFYPFMKLIDMYFWQLGAK